MRELFVLFSLMVGMTGFNQAQDQLPVRGFCIGAPDVSYLDQFVKFIDEELALRNVNALVLRIDYNYEFESHPELRMEGGLSKGDVKKLVKVCKKHDIRLIPQIDLLGHQSWATQLGKLLQVYPEFDETPNVKIPEKYKWPNADSLYCKSYCPLHPGVHKVVFELIDEICDAFESYAFHAGMDEVFYIGYESCPRCAGHNKAELFANEVNLIRNHLALKKRQLWIWGDRLIDGKTTGIGEWEGSMNNTYPAIDLIAKDVMICDWHYESPHQTPVLFAMKGLSVVTCSWKKGECAITQTQDMYRFRKYATPEMKDRYQGMMQTVWEGAGTFLDEFYGKKKAHEESESACFKALFSEINKVSSGK